MRGRSVATLAILGLISGCVGASRPEDRYAETAAEIQLTAAEVAAFDSSPAGLQADLDGEHSLEFYLNLALEQNPEILAAERELAAAGEVVPQASSLEDPMLVNTFMPFTNHSVQTAAGRGTHTLLVMQRFPWLGKLRLRGEVAERETGMAMARLAQTYLKVIENVRIAYYELAFNQQAIEITREDEELLKEIIKVIDARFRAGNALQQDLLGAQVELTRVQERLIGLQRQLRLSQADLAALLHLAPGETLRAAQPGDPPSTPDALEGLYEAAVSYRPELQERLWAILRDQQLQELARLESRPDVTLGVGWQDITTDRALSAAANGNDNYSLTLGVNLPIWKERIRAGVREAQHRTIASAQRYEAERDETFRLIRRLVAQARALQEQIRLFREPGDGILPKSRQTLKLSLSNYETGEVDFQQLIENWSRLLAFQIQVIRLEANLRQVLASLERVVGIELTSLGEPQPAAPQRLPDPAAPIRPGEDSRRGKGTEVQRGRGKKVSLSLCPFEPLTLAPVPAPEPE